MTFREYIDLFRKHYPDASITEIKRRLNRGKRVFLGKARIYDSSWNVSTVADQRYYGLTDEIIAVERVDYDGEKIGRLQGSPDTRDLT